MSPHPTTFGVGLGDQRSHIEARDPIIIEEGPPMTPEQFETLISTLRVLLSPGHELAKRYLAQLDAMEAHAAASHEPPPAANDVAETAPEDPAA